MLTTNTNVRMDELMKRRWKALLMIVILVLTLFTTVQAKETPSIIHIDQYDDIQAMIDASKPNTILYFSPGTYNQTFRIDKQITLTSKDPEKTFINVTTNQNKPAITISASRVCLSNMTIQNNGPGLYTTGIRILSDQIFINNCVFQNTPIGISIWSNNNSITRNTFVNCKDEGIVLLSTAYSSANNNTISHCVFKDNCDAIELQQSCYNLIEHCVMINNTHSGIDAIIKNNNYNTISNCTITNNKVNGIYFTHSKENKIIDCVIAHNTDGDICTPESENITIINRQENISIFSEPESGINNHDPIESEQNIKNEQSTLISIIMKFLNKIRMLFNNK